MESAASQALPQDRLKLAAMAMNSNANLHPAQNNENKGSTAVVDANAAKNIIAQWPDTAKMAAQNTINFYGPPNEATPGHLIWYNNGPWKRTIAFREEFPHNFPEPHTDVLEQFIDYHVPTDKAGLVAQIEGSIIIDRTKGEVSAHCDNEGANTLSLNMMHEVVTGERTPEEARDFIAKELVEYLMGRPAPYCENFQFGLPQGDQWDADVAVVQDPALNREVTTMQQTLGLKQH